MKLKTHIAFKTQLDTLEESVGLLWFIVEQPGQHHRIERMKVVKINSSRDLDRFFTPNKYKFIKVHNQMPVFKKL